MLLFFTKRNGRRTFIAKREGCSMWNTGVSQLDKWASSVICSMWNTFCSLVVHLSTAAGSFAFSASLGQHHFYSPFTFPKSSLDPLAGDWYPHTVLDVVFALNLPWIRRNSSRLHGFHRFINGIHEHFDIVEHLRPAAIFRRTPLFSFLCRIKGWPFCPLRIWSRNMPG